MEKFYYVYVLQSLVDKKFYIGYTTNLEKRLLAHNSGNNLSTKYRRPLKYLYYEAYVSKLDALGREKFLKSGSGHRYLYKQLKFTLVEQQSPSAKISPVIN